MTLIDLKYYIVSLDEGRKMVKQTGIDNPDLRVLSASECVVTSANEFEGLTALTNDELIEYINTNYPTQEE